MKNKFYPLLILCVATISIAATFGVLTLLSKLHQSIQTETVGVHAVGSTILATGTIHSTQEATLHFQTGGKLVFLPFKEGDNVTQGQTIAQLDTFALQKELTQALNTYRSTRDTFDQTQQNTQTNLYQSTQAFGLNSQQAAVNGNTENTIINDMAKRIVDQNQANLDTAVINVQLANDALQLATLTAPFTGIVTHEDVTVAGQNITPLTSFSVADPTTLVFRADVAVSDIDFVEVGMPATIQINGLAIPGNVLKIYPQKITLPTDEEVYEVDIQGQNDLSHTTKLGETGNVLIESIARQDSVLVPTWTILGHNHIWVEENGKAVLLQVAVGKTHGDQTEISGVSPSYKIITNPQSIATRKYSLL